MVFDRFDPDAKAAMLVAQESARQALVAVGVTPQAVGDVLDAAPGGRIHFSGVEPI